MSENHVTVLRTHDPVEAEMMAELLCDSGLDARVIGSRNGPLIGVAPHILALRIEVPASQAAEATELVAAFSSAPSPADDSAPELPASAQEEAEWERRRDRRSPLLAAGATFVCFGGSHFYARRPYTGALIALGQLGAGAVMLWGSRLESIAATILVASLVICDLIGGQLATWAFNRGVRAAAGKQLLIGLLAVLGSGALGVLLAPHVPPPRQPAMEPLLEPPSLQDIPLLPSRT